jgi:hypothetical protein
VATSLNSDGDLHPHVSSRVLNEPLPNPMPYLAFRRTHAQANAIGPVVSKPPSSSRGAVVKAGIVQASEASSLGQKTGRHLNYLTRDGSGPDDLKAELFTKYSASQLSVQISRRQRWGFGHYLGHRLHGPVEGMRLLIPFTDAWLKLGAQMVFRWKIDHTQMLALQDTEPLDLIKV